MSPGRQDPRPKAASLSTTPKKKLSASEAQLIHALEQDRNAGRMIEPFLNEGYLAGAWSFPVIAGLIQNPDRNIEHVLGSLEDVELRQAIRAALFDKVAPVKPEEILASIAQLNDSQLVQKQKEIQQKLTSEDPGAQRDLASQLMDIARTKMRSRT
jgi:hypothetical protein